MTDITLEPGCILHWDGFKLSDGSEGHKCFVIVGARAGCNYLAIRATSKARAGRNYVPGGNPDAGWYHIPGGGKDWFQNDTCLLFAEPEEWPAAELLKFYLNGKITIKGNLRADIANAICNCMRKCEDVSEYHTSLLGPPLQPKKK